MFIKRISIIALGLLIFIGLVGCTSSNPSSSPQSDKGTAGGEQAGGTLKVAYNSQPETLDPHATTAEATKDPARLIFEALVTLNKNYEVTPQLVESYKISADNKSVVFKVRKGVKFHNGKEMKAEDVVASMEKWDKSSALAKANFVNPKWVVKDDYTVELQLDKPSSIIMNVLADQSQMAAIMPKEIVDKAGPTGVTEYIGTGPFKLVDWKKDQYIHFTKFKDYKPLSTPASGLAGKKVAKVNDLYWYFVTDESTRVTGLISGQYDFAHMLSYDAVDQIKNTPGKVVDVWPYGMEVLVFNKKHGIFTNVKARQAVNYALDKEAVMQAAFADKKYYDLDPSPFLPDQKDWYTDAGKELYNPKDLNKAKELLKESGYHGQEVVILTSRDYQYHYNSAVATQQQLEKIGINAKLEVYDWATLLERRSHPEDYDIFFTGWPVETIPQQFTFLDSKAGWPGWTNDPKLDQLLDDIQTQKNHEDAKAKYAELQKEMWEYLPIINVGMDSRVSGYSDKVKGYTDFLGPVFWNVSVNK